MKAAVAVAYEVVRRFPPIKAGASKRIAHDPGSDAYERAYSQDQFDRVARKGVIVAVDGLDVLEVGCGHGGISVALALLGARTVVGIDINTTNLERARTFAAERERRLGQGVALPLRFIEADGCDLPFEQKAFDLVLTDNAFEHFTDPGSVMREAFRVLRPGGRLVVPIFSSILSQYGLHIKNATSLPWLNLFFSERTIVRAMSRLAVDRPELLDLYPGLRGEPKRVRDLRKHGDLNDITYRTFRSMAMNVGFEIAWFRPFPTKAGFVLRALPFLRDSVLADVFSQGAAAILRRPLGSDSVGP